MTITPTTENGAINDTTLTACLDRFKWQWVPVDHDSKKPIISNWQQEFHHAPEQARKYRRTCQKKWPNARDGVLTGAPPFYLHAIDADARNGGLETLATLSEKLPRTLTVKTPNGFHLLYHSAIPIIGGTNRFGPGVDLKGITRNGKPQLCIMPPSPGYIFLPHGAGQLHVETFPMSLLAGTQPTLIQASDPEIKWVFNVKAWVGTKYGYAIDEMSDARPGDRRNTKLNSIAYNLGRYVPFGYIDEDQIKDDLLDAALQAGEDETASISTINSGIAAGKNRPIELKVYGETDETCDTSTLNSGAS